MKAFIFLLEDNPTERDLFIMHLKHSTSAEILSAEDGATAIKIISETNPKPLLFILDLMMPGEIKGKDVLRFLCSNAEYDRSAKIILSSSDSTRDIEECHEIGCTEYAQKPKSNIQTKALIKGWLENYKNGI